MGHKYRNHLVVKSNYFKGRDRSGGGTFYIMLILIILIQIVYINTEGKDLQQNVKTLKSYKSIFSSLIQLRHKRETFTNEHKRPPFVRDNVSANQDYDDDNHDVIPDVITDGFEQPTLSDQISESAKKIAESFSNMWQSLTDSIRHCTDAFSRLFTDKDDGELMAQQEQQVRVAMGEHYRVINVHDNEIEMNVFENNL